MDLSVAALISNQGFERGDPHDLCPRGAAMVLAPKAGTSGLFGNAQKRTRVPEADLFHILLRQIERFKHCDGITDVAWTPLGIEGAVGSK
jgi:hypothetical protein